MNRSDTLHHIYVNQIGPVFAKFLEVLLMLGLWWHPIDKTLLSKNSLFSLL